MLQLPPDSHCATASQLCPEGGAGAGGAGAGASVCEPPAGGLGGGGAGAGWASARRLCRSTSAFRACSSCASTDLRSVRRRDANCSASACAACASSQVVCAACLERSAAATAV